MVIVQWIGALLGGIFLVSIITMLLRGQWRKFPLLLPLMVVELLGMVTSIAATFDLGRWTRETAKIYWINEGVQFAVLFALQVQMLYQSLDEEKRTYKKVAYLVVGGVIYGALAIWLGHERKFSLWMTEIVRNFSFGCMILNLALWTTLIRKFDHQRLMISAAVGIMLAGAAIGHSLRQLSPSLVPLGNLMIIILYVFYLFLLFRALAKAPVTASVESGQRNQIPQTSM